MKRRISVTLCAVLSAVVLAACGTKGAEEPASEQEAVSEQISEEPDNAAEEEPTPTESIDEVDREVTPAADFSTNDISDEEQEDLEDLSQPGPARMMPPRFRWERRYPEPLRVGPMPGLRLLQGIQRVQLIISRL